MSRSLPKPIRRASDAARPRPMSESAVGRLFAVVAVVFGLLAGASVVPATAAQSPTSRSQSATAALSQPASLQQSTAVGSPNHVRPHMHSCDDPDWPCYTAPQMHAYLVHRTHHFLPLSTRFRFPARFIHLAQAAHATWCRHHPAACKAQKRQFAAERLANPGDGCGPGWWCTERQMISCAGGALVPYWSCAGAYSQYTAQELDQKLSTTDKMLIVGGDTMLCFLFPPGAPIVIGTGLVSMFNVWLANS